jgi:hypothetical protein
MEEILKDINDMNNREIEEMVVGTEINGNNKAIKLLIFLLRYCI